MIKPTEVRAGKADNSLAEKIEFYNGPGAAARAIREYRRGQAGTEVIANLKRYQPIPGTYLEIDGMPYAVVLANYNATEGKWECLVKTIQ